MIPTLNKVVLDIPEALSIFVNQIVYDKKAQGERVYTYSLGEAFFEVPRFEIPDEQWNKGNHYSGSMGQPALRKKLSALYKQYGVEADPNTEILVSAGSKVIIFMVLQAVLNPADEVLVPEPAWLSYKEQIKLAGGVHVAVPYHKTVAQWEEYITPKTKVIIINNPTNPSGKLFSREEYQTLLALARKHNLFILSDEAYSDFLLPRDTFTSFAQVDTTKENTIVVNSLSKNMSISGWRIGYAVGHARVIRELLKLNQHLITCAPTILQNYLADHFDQILAQTQPQARQTAQKRRAVSEILAKVGITPLEGVGTFYFLLDVSAFKGTTEELVYDLLLNHNIATVPGAAYGESTRRFIRFGIGVENLEDIEKSLGVIKSFLDLPHYDNTAIRRQMKERGII